eukprot:22741-Pelagococcus_subviridis.AAC.1
MLEERQTRQRVERGLLPRPPREIDVFGRLPGPHAHARHAARAERVVALVLRALLPGHDEQIVRLVVRPPGRGADAVEKFHLAPRRVAASRVKVPRRVFARAHVLRGDHRVVVAREERRRGRGRRRLGFRSGGSPRGRRVFNLFDLLLRGGETSRPRRRRRRERRADVFRAEDVAHARRPRPRDRVVVCGIAESARLVSGIATRRER